MSKVSKAIAVLGVVAGLGVAALPLSSYAVSDAANVTAQAIVGDSIAITAETSTVSMTPASGGSVMANQDAAEGTTNIKVQTNNAGGYQVQIKDTDGSDLALKPTGTGTATGIPAGIPAKNTNAWGYKAESSSTGVNVITSEYTAITGNQKKIAEHTAPSANEGDIIELTFGVTVDTSIAAGTYQNDVTLTATTL